MRKLYVLLFAFVNLASYVSAQAPLGFKYQAVARNNSGALIENTAISIRVKIHDVSASGTVIYQETHKPTTGASGLFNLTIGTGTVETGVFATLDWSSGSKFIELAADLAGGSTYQSMGTSQLLSVPYALYAAKSPSSGWGLSGNSGTTESTNFIGTTDNVPLVFKVNNELGGKIDPPNYDTYFGYQAGNMIAPMNKGGNSAFGHQALTTTTNTSRNTAFGFKTLFADTWGDGNTAMGFNALTANVGGLENTAIGQYALFNNTAGAYNVAAGSSSLYFNDLGGYNVALGYEAMHGNQSASENVAIGYDAMMANKTASLNCAVGAYASQLTTGQGNTSVGHSALSSNTTGTNNSALGYLAFANGASFSNSTAIGANANVTASNMMVFGDNAVTKWGFGVSPAAGNAFQVGANATNGNGAYLTNGGTWTNASDRNKKENFTSLDSKMILSKIMQLPITRWNYKGEPASVTHIGPMAQDFYALFKVGSDDKTISTIDPAGVSLAAIQELIIEIENLKKIVFQQTETIDGLKVENASLKSDLGVRLKTLEAILMVEAKK